MSEIGGYDTGAEPPAEVTSYIGRDAELGEAMRLLGTSRLVTLSGPGGVGKTRLAVRVLGRLTGRFPDGVTFVGLAELHDPTLVPDVIANQLGLKDLSARPAPAVVLSHLRERRSLLVLDNCEHLLDACAELARAVLSACPHVVVVTTSRQSLGVEGERVLAVPPLSVPGAEQIGSAQHLESYDAVRLFVDRASSVLPSFEVTDDNATALATLCRRLEGLPLAIELAAVRIRSLSVAQLAERLTQRLPLLTSGPRTAPERQQTLRATLDWSYELCSAAEQLLWQRCAIFAGTFDLTAAEQICAGDGVNQIDVLDLIDSLLDKSVLAREEAAGPVRYRMLETLREYGQERLTAAGDRQRIARRHRDYYARLTTRFEAEWLSKSQIDWVDRMRNNHPDLRLAMEYSVAQPGEAGTTIAIGKRTLHYWLLRGYFGEARMWMERGLSGLTAGDPAHGTGLWLVGLAALMQGDFGVAAQHLTDAQRWAESNDDDVLAARVATGWAVASVFGGDVTTPVRALGAALETFRAHHLLADELFATFLAGLALGLGGDATAGRTMLGAGLTASEDCGELYFRSWLLFSLAQIEIDDGQLASGATVARKALRMHWEIDNRFLVAMTTDMLAWIARRQGDPHRAGTLFGAAEEMFATIGTKPSYYPSFGRPHDHNVELTRAALGHAGFERAFARGRALPLGTAVRYAMDEEREPERGGLTKRQYEIARLVAAGMSNQEIATALVIAKRTAETHVEHILRKLGFSSRAQIAAWMAGGHS